MATLQETFERLTTLPKFRADRPATDEEIRRIQTELNLRLPDEYLQFLKRFGYVHWFGHEIYGIRPINPATGEPSITPDCAKVTKGEKKPNNPLGTSSLPPAHVVISTDGGGGNFVLFGIGAPHEGEVHYYNFEDQAEPIRTWKTFQDFLEHRIAEATGA
jgi:antitoxin YobK